MFINKLLLHGSRLFSPLPKKTQFEKTQLFAIFQKTQVKEVPKSGFFASLYYISFQKTQEKNSENSIFRDFQFFQIRLCVQKKSLFVKGVDGLHDEFWAKVHSRAYGDDGKLIGTDWGHL